MKEINSGLARQSHQVKLFRYLNFSISFSYQGELSKYKSISQSSTPTKNKRDRNVFSDVHKPLNPLVRQHSQPSQNTSGRY